jgi:hypothetical protein
MREEWRANKLTNKGGELRNGENTEIRECTALSFTCQDIKSDML